MYLISIISLQCILAYSVLAEDDIEELHREQERTERRYRGLIDYCKAVIRSMGEHGQEGEWRTQLKDLRREMESLRKEFNSKTVGLYYQSDFLKQETAKLEYDSKLQQIQDITGKTLTYALTTVQGSGNRVAQCSSSELFGDLSTLKKEIAQFNKIKEKEPAIVSDINKAIQENGSTDINTLKKLIPKAIKSAGEIIDVASEICTTADYYDSIMKYNVGAFNGGREGLIQKFDGLLGYIDAVSPKARASSKPEFKNIRDAIEGAKAKIPEKSTGEEEDAVDEDSKKQLVSAFDEYEGMEKELVDVSNKALAKEVKIVGSFLPVLTDFLLPEFGGSTDDNSQLLGRLMKNLIGEVKTFVTNPKVTSMDSGVEEMGNFVELNLGRGTEMQNRFEQYVKQAIGCDASTAGQS